MYLAYWTLLIALSLSLVAAWYSIIGLTAIFAAAVVPVIIMGAILEVAKVSVTVWLHRYWNQCQLLMKIYLVPAVLLLMLITSMGIFGYLSKAHLDQGVPSGDVAAQLALYDEKIKTERENIEAARKALQQMDASVDQTMARSTTEQGASKAFQIRKSQTKERTSLQNDIATAQSNIAKLNQERAPIASQLRRVEAEVGPIKYVAALIYGDSVDATALERAVRWIIIILVSVFDPLAIMLVLAATESMVWEKAKKIKKEVPIEEDYGNCPKCDSKLFHAPGIGPYCPNKDCDVIDNILNWNAPEVEIGLKVPDFHDEVDEPIVEEIINEINEPIIEEPVVDEPVVNEDPAPVSNYVDPKIAAGIWKSMSGHSTLKEQRRLLEQGRISKLPWEEEEFLNLIRSGKLK